jgi:DNA polymerase-1
MSVVVLVDSSGWVHRSYHAWPKLTRKDGHPVGAVAGFASMLYQMRRRPLLPDITHMAAIFDAGGRSFRHEIYPQYKGQRPAKDDDLLRQFPLVREAAKVFGLAVVEMPGVEADDLIATYSRLAVADGHSVVIYSGDKDLLQLVGPHVCVFDAKNYRLLTEDDVFDRLGVPPSVIPDLLALTGDTVDNIPGVPSVGPKTAAKLLAHYGDLGAIFAAITGDGFTLPAFITPKLRRALLDHAAVALQSRRLTVLNPMVPMPSWSLDRIAAEPVDAGAVLDFLVRNELPSLGETIKKEWSLT